MPSETAPSETLSLPLPLSVSSGVSGAGARKPWQNASDGDFSLSGGQQKSDRNPGSAQRLETAYPRETVNLPETEASQEVVRDAKAPDGPTPSSAHPSGPAFVLTAPERIHPALWRASQIACSPGLYASTGYPEISAQLPGGGWPLGNLIEVMTPRAGIGELQLFRHALSCQAGSPGCRASSSASDARVRNEHDQRPIVLIQPPYVPQTCAWAHWGVAPSRLLWLSPRGMADALWAAEHILNSGAFAALVVWQDSLRDAALRRLQLAAQKGDTLFVLVRGLSAARQSSPAPLRLVLHPVPTGLHVHIVKRRGSLVEQPVHITLYSDDAGRFVSTDPANIPDQPHSAYPAAFTEFYDANMDSRTSTAPYTGHTLS